MRSLWQTLLDNVLLIPLLSTTAGWILDELFDHSLVWRIASFLIGVVVITVLVCLNDRRIDHRRRAG